MTRPRGSIVICLTLMACCTQDVWAQQVRCLDPGVIARVLRARRQDVRRTLVRLYAVELDLAMTTFGLARLHRRWSRYGCSRAGRLSGSKPTSARCELVQHHALWLSVRYFQQRARALRIMSAAHQQRARSNRRLAREAYRRLLWTTPPQRIRFRASDLVGKGIRASQPGGDSPSVEYLLSSTLRNLDRIMRRERRQLRLARRLAHQVAGQRRPPSLALWFAQHYRRDSRLATRYASRARRCSLVAARLQSNTWDHDLTLRIVVHPLLTPRASLLQDCLQQGTKMRPRPPNATTNTSNPITFSPASG